jgi:hypothetical protein
VSLLTYGGIDNFVLLYQLTGIKKALNQRLFSHQYLPFITERELMLYWLYQMRPMHRKP